MKQIVNPKLLELLEEVNHPSYKKIQNFINSIEKDESFIINDLEDLEGAVNGLERKLFLDLSNENITVIPDKVFECSNIILLNISNNKIKDISRLVELESLQFILARGCLIEKIPQKINNCQELVLLDLESNLIKELSNDFYLPKLAVLDLSKNEVEYIPNNISRHQYLFDLDLRQNPLTDFNEVCNLPNLKKLSLSACDLKELPVEIGNLGNLEILYLEGNDLSELPSTIGDLAKLKTLHLEGNSLSELPSTIGNLTNLEDLHLRSTSIKKLSLEFSNLKKLSHLCISSNLDEIPEVIFSMESLTELDLDENNIKSIPDKIDRLKEIKLLSLGSNKISEIPKSIGNLENIEYLDISNNKLHSLPEDLFNLQSLKGVLLGRNYLTELPTNLGNAKNLEKLNLISNKVSFLPPSIGNLSKLTNLSLDFNNLQEYPVELSKLKDINNIYTFENHSNPLTNMPETKSMGLVKLFDFLENSNGVNNHFVFWDIPNNLRIAFEHYLDYFPLYVKNFYKEDIVFDVIKVNGGIKLKTQSTATLPLEQIDIYLNNYINIFLEQKYEDFNESDLVMQNKIELFELKQFIRDLKMENRILTDKVRNHYDQSLLLKEIIGNQKRQIEDFRFMFRNFKSESAKFLNLETSKIDPITIKLDVQLLQDAPLCIDSKMKHSLTQVNETFDHQVLLKELTDKAVRILEKKKIEKIEDLHNNDFVHFLRDRFYYATDQTQSGISLKNYGELDIMIRKVNGTPVSILEAFRLSSAGPKNTEISSHIDKLLHDYDTAGHKTNYVIVYAEAAKFQDLWSNYITYMQDLNSKPNFRNDYPLISFLDTGKNEVTDIKIGHAIHRRENENISVYHLFINMK